MREVLAMRFRDLQEIEHKDTIFANFYHETSLASSGAI